MARLGGLTISCSKLHSDIFFTSLSCICVISFLFSIPYDFFCSSSNARLLQSRFSFVSSRLISQLRKNRLHHNQSSEILVLHDLWYLLFFVEFIHCIVNDGVVFLLSVNFFPGYRAVLVVLSRSTISVLSSKVPQDLTFFQRISGAFDETGFGFSRRDIYIPFSALSSSLALLGDIPWQGGFSYLFPAVTITVGVFPSMFFIIGFYYTFVNRLGNLHSLKHVNSFFLRDIITIKASYIGLFVPDIRHNIKEDFV